MRCNGTFKEETFYTRCKMSNKFNVGNRQIILSSVYCALLVDVYYDDEKLLSKITWLSGLYGTIVQPHMVKL